MKKLIPLILKEIKELSRDKLTVIVIIFIPSLLLFIYGYAISLDVKEVKIVVCDQDFSKDSRSLIYALTASGYFKIVAKVSNEREVDEYLIKGKAWAGIIIDKDFSMDLKNGKGAGILIMLDGSNGYTSQTVIRYFYGALMHYMNKEAVEIKLKTGRDVPIIKTEQRIWYNPLLESSLSLIPGLIALVMMIVAVIATTLSIVREKETGTIEQMIITPISASQIVLGKIIPYFLLSVIASFLMVVIGHYMLDVPFKGSIVLFSIALMLFLIGALGLGLFISAKAESQQVAFIISVLTTMLPTIILSNFIFPINSMPKIIQWITYIVPAKYFIAIIRAIMLKGAGLSALRLQYIALVIFALISLLIGIKAIGAYMFAHKRNLIIEKKD